MNGEFTNIENILNMGGGISNNITDASQKKMKKNKNFIDGISSGGGDNHNECNNNNNNNNIAGFITNPNKKNCDGGGDDKTNLKKRKRYDISSDDDDEEEEEDDEDEEEDEEEDDDDDDEDEDVFINDDDEEEEEEDDDDEEEDDKRSINSNNDNKKIKEKASTAEFGSVAKKNRKKNIAVDDKRDDDKNNNDTLFTSISVNNVKTKKIKKDLEEKKKKISSAKLIKKNNPTIKVNMNFGGEKKKKKINNNNNNNNNDSNNKKKENQIDFKMEKKFYNQIRFQIKANEEFTGEVKKKILSGCCNSNNNNNTYTINELDDIEFDEYLRLNFYHQKNGEMILAEKPPPIKHKYVLKLFELIFQYFSSEEVENCVKDVKTLNQVKNFVHKLKVISNQDYEKIYYILLTYYYAFESYWYYKLTGKTFIQPHDPLIDFSYDDIPIRQLSLSKRNNQKFNTRKDDKKFNLLKTLINIVVKNNRTLKLEEVVDNNLEYLILCDIKKTLNCDDPRIFKHISLAGLVFCVSYLCDVIQFGYRRIKFKNVKL